jgi:hypothetical protein
VADRRGAASIDTTGKSSKLLKPNPADHRWPEFAADVHNATAEAVLIGGLPLGLPPYALT